MRRVSTSPRNYAARADVAVPTFALDYLQRAAKVEVALSRDGITYDEMAKNRVRFHKDYVRL